MMNDEAHLRGIRGWLLLLCLSLTVFDPLAMLLNIFVVTNLAKTEFENHPELMRLILINGGCSIGLAVFSIYAGVSLWKTLPNGVRLAKKYLLTACLYSIFGLVLPSLVGVAADFQKQIIGGSVVNSAVTVAYLGCWYQYLKRSRRVKTTFGL